MSLLAQAPDGELHLVFLWVRPDGDVHKIGMPGDRLYHVRFCNGLATWTLVSGAGESDISLSPRSRAFAIGADGRLHVVCTRDFSTDAPTVVYRVGR